MPPDDHELESQSEAVEEATPGDRRGAPTATEERPPSRKGKPEVVRPKSLLQPVRDAMAAVRARFEALPGRVRVAALFAFLGAAAAVPAILPYLLQQSTYWTLILTKIGIAALLALGLNVVVGFAGLLDLGYVAFFAVGAYSFALLSGAAQYSVKVYQSSGIGKIPPFPTWHMYYWLFFFLGLGIALICGVILGAPTLRLRGDYLAIVTLGFGEIVRITANNLDTQVNGPRGVNHIPNPAINVGSFHYSFGLSNDPYYWLLLGIIGVWIILLRRLNDSRVGRAWAAIREDELAAAAMGVATVRMKLLAFAIGASVASFAGVIYASQISFISPDTFSLFNPAFGSVIILAMVVLGGMGSIAGPILGAALIIWAPEYFRSLSDARFMVFGLVLVVVMVLRPQGLIPSRRRAAELRGGDIKDTSVFEVQEHAR